VGSSYHYLLVGAGGLSPYTWSLIGGTFPGGLTFAPVIGDINGTPTNTGNYFFNVRLTDQSGQIQETQLNILVSGPPQPLQLQPLPLSGPNRFGLRINGDVGRTYSLQYTTTWTNWVTILTTNGIGGPMDLTDSNATNQFRIYRVMANP
jgi:hypothetical protein